MSSRQIPGYSQGLFTSASKKRNENSVRQKEYCNVSFSASSGGELADHASKLVDRAQRKAKEKVNNVGVDMNEIRNTPGIGSRVDDFMQNVDEIPSLSLGNKPAGKAKSRKSKETQSKNRSSDAFDSSAHQPFNCSDGTSSAVSTDNLTLAAILAQQQSMTANQMKMCMDFQQQQQQEQQLQMQSLLGKFQSSTGSPKQKQQNLSPSSAEKRVEAIVNKIQ